MLKKLSICIWVVLLIAVTFGAAHAEEDLPDLTLDELIQWKQSTLPEYVSDDMAGQVICGNLYEEYYGVRAASVGNPVRAFATCDHDLFRVGVTSTITVHATDGTAPYRYSITPYRRDPKHPYDEENNYLTYGLQSSYRMLSITPDTDVYQYMVVTTVTDASGYYVRFYSKYETASEASLADPTTVPGKVQAVIAEVIKDGMTDRQKAKAIHDWLIYNAYYDTSLQIHEPDGVLLLGTGVCESYARSFQMFMSELGIPNTYVSSDVMDHAWNMIYVDGGWYHVDVTFDDPVVKGLEYRTVSGYENDDFFCVTDSYMMEHEHRWNDRGLATPPTGYGPIYPETSPVVTSDVTLGKTSIRIPAGGEALFRFTAPSTGSYVFETTEMCDTAGYLLNGEMTAILSEDDDIRDGNNFRIVYPLTSGETVVISAKHPNPNDPETEVLSVSKFETQTAPSSTLTTLTGNSISVLSNSAKPKLVIFTLLGDSASQNMIEALNGYDLSALDVFIAEVSGEATPGETRDFYNVCASRLTGATMCYGGENYMYRLLSYVDLGPAFYVPVVFYIDSNCRIVDCTAGPDSNMFPRIQKLLGVNLVKTDFANSRLVLPSDTEIIEEEAFTGVAAELIEIPASCISIAPDAFSECQNLKIILNHSNLAITAPAGVVVTDLPQG